VMPMKKSCARKNQNKSVCDISDRISGSHLYKKECGTFIF
jgi:hypothetical protein